MDPLYQAPLAQLAQGDIFSDVPSLILPGGTLTFLRRRETKHGPLADLHILGDDSHAPKKPFNPNLDESVANVQLAAAMLLTHACEFDNSPRAGVAVALIRPLRTVPEDSRDAITSGRNLRVLPLPENDDPPFEASYIDFSRITTVRAESLPLDRRILSASADLLRALYVGIIRYYTRYDINPSTLDDIVKQAIAEATRAAE